jgi:hypothetical protein
MALERGYSVDAVHALTKIDRWFLSKLKNIALMKAAVSRAAREGKNMQMPTRLSFFVPFLLPFGRASRPAYRYETVRPRPPSTTHPPTHPPTNQ